MPYDLGGLFYQMSVEIIDNGFALPAAIPYYYPGGLPFAYPPLPFYLQALFLRFINPGLFVAVNLLPALFSLLSLVAFVPLARRALPKRWAALAAVFTFAALPVAYVEQVQAMGLAESLGTLCLVLYTLSLLWAKDGKPITAWVVPGVLLALCALAGALFAFTLSLDEFVITYFTIAAQTTLPMYVFSQVKFGVTPKIKKLADSGLKARLALSLHAATQAKRIRIMPVAQTFGLEKLMEAVRYFAEKTGDRVTIELSPYDLSRGRITWRAK